MTMATINPFLPLMIPIFLFAAAGGDDSGELWCVAKNNAEDAALQAALDWACGPGGADCGPIQQGGPCYSADDLQSVASYAFNDYFIKHGSDLTACNFSDTAAVISLNPSRDKCIFPSSSAAGNGSAGASAGLGPAGEGVSGTRGPKSWLPALWFSIVILVVSLSTFADVYQ